MGYVSSTHIPVLLKEALDLLITDADGIYFDGTLGDGGYTRGLLEELGSAGRVVAADWDEQAIAFADTWRHKVKNRISIYHSNFCSLSEILRQEGMQSVSGIVLDLGLSSRQIDDAERGFSYRREAPLDMRMDMRLTTTARDILKTASEQELAQIFFMYGEEKRSRLLARIIIEERSRRSFTTTFDLIDIMKKQWRPAHFTKSASRIFQALRIAVNRELDNLERFLEDCWQFVVPGGRVAIVSYHSLEDRIVKTAFRNHSNPCVCPKNVPVCQCGRTPDVRVITKRPITPSCEEIFANPHSRSAKLRAAEKI